MKRSIWTPLALAIAMVMGLYIGHISQSRARLGTYNQTAGEGAKVRQLLRLIQSEYVETIDTDSLMDLAIADMLHRLDPHSTYIPAQQVSANEEEMQGRFEGIGIEFQLYKDTVTIVRIIEDGPAQRAGLMAGDRIYGVEDSLFFGPQLNTDKVVGRIKGPGGSTVSLQLRRAEDGRTEELRVVRGSIPLPSVDVAFMLNEGTGFIKLSRFAETSAEEFRRALVELKDAGMEKLLLDLRDNPGGLMDAAREISDEFLSDGQKIVMTKDRKNEERSYYASSQGVFQNGPMAILINEGSASASEIVAGALQDHRRAVIVGRRSFGKGLVQQEMNLSDGSRVRLTTYRYFTPNGRSIQKPYTGDYESYQQETFERGWTDDTLRSADEARELEEGGIAPERTVSLEAVSADFWVYHKFPPGLIDDWAFEYIDLHRKKLSEWREETFISSFNAAELIPDLLTYAEVDANQLDWEHGAVERLAQRMKALLARNLYGLSAFYPIYLQDDPFVEAATQELAK